jgi:hypothetical protein
VVERRITYGEIFLTVIGIASLAVFLLRWAYDFVVRWLHHD